jgi:hypothetical protein
MNEGLSLGRQNIPRFGRLHEVDHELERVDLCTSHLEFLLVELNRFCRRIQSLFQIVSCMGVDLKQVGPGGNDQTTHKVNTRNFERLIAQK